MTKADKHKTPDTPCHPAEHQFCLCVCVCSITALRIRIESYSSLCHTENSVNIFSHPNCSCRKYVGSQCSYSPGPSLPAIPGILEGFSKPPLMAGKLPAKSTISLPSVEFLGIFPRNKKGLRVDPLKLAPQLKSSH